MRIRSRFLLLLLPAVLLAAVGYLSWYVRSGRFLEFARATLIAKVEGATGMLCSVERIHLDVLRGRFRLQGLALMPRTGGAGPLKLHIEEVSGRIGVSSLWHFRLNLAELDVVRPQVTLASTGSGGGWNPEDFLNSLRVSLSLAAGKIVLSDGWVEFNNRQIPLNLSLDDVTCEVRYAALPPSYKVRLGYRNGRLLWESRDIVYDLEADVSVSMAGVDVETYTFRHGKTLLAGDGWVRDWRSPVLLLHATGNLDAADLYLFSSDLGGARGDINVATNCRLGAAGLRFDGKFDLRSVEYRRAQVSSLQGAFEIRDDVLRLRDVAGKFGEGTVQADGAIQLREANVDPHHLNVTAQGIRLSDVGKVLNLPELDLENTADSSARLAWKHTQDLDLEVAASLHAFSGSPPERGTLLQGTSEFSYRQGVWYITSADLTSPYTNIQVTGLGGSRFHIKGHTTRLSEPLSVLRGFVPSIDRLVSRQPDLLAISGFYGLDGDMRAEASRTAYQGEVRIRDGGWRSYGVDELAAKLSWEDTHLELLNMTLRRGDESGDGDLTLEIPSEEGESPGLTFHGRVSHVSLSSLKDLGLGIESGITGRLSGDGTLSNAKGNWNGEAQFLIEKGSFKGEQFDSVRGRIAARDQILRIEDCQISQGAANVTARGQVHLDTRQMQVSVRLAGLQLQELPAIQERKLDVGGRIAASGTLRGTPDDPTFNGEFELTGLRYPPWDLGSGKGTVELRDNVVRVSAAVLSDLGNISATASLSLESGFPGKASIEFSDLNIQKILFRDVPAPLSEVSTALRGKLELSGKLSDPQELAGSGEVDGGRLKIRDYELHNEGMMRFAVSSRNLRIEKVNIVGEGTSLSVSGILPLDGSPRLDVGLSGSLNLIFLERLEQRLLVRGSAALNVRATGVLAEPQVIGQAVLQNVRLEYGDFPVRLSATQGTVVFSRNLVRFEGMRGSAGSGSIRLSGAIEHDTAQLRGINLQISASGVRLPYPKDFRSVVDAELSLRGNQESQVLSGDIHVIRSDYMRSFSLLEQLASRSNPAGGPLTTDSFLMGLRLDVDIHSDRGLFVDNELTRLRGSARLNLRGTPAYPYLTGRVEATEGTIFFRGSRFEIMHASADFVDRNRINPILDVRAEADVKTYRLVMDVTGELDHMGINVTSDPPLSTVEIVSLLTTGKEPGTENTRQQSQMTGISAASILSEGLTGVIGKRVERIFGLQTFRIDPFLAGTTNDPTARITISERISKDLTVTFSRNLSTNEEQIVVLEYDVTRNLSVVASRDEQGKFGLDFRFQKRFR